MRQVASRPLVAGVLVRNATAQGDVLHHAIEGSALPVYLVFFAVTLNELWRPCSIGRRWWDRARPGPRIRSRWFRQRRFRRRRTEQPGPA